MENLELLRNFDGVALLIALALWAAAFNAWRAQRFKHMWLDAEVACAVLRAENARLWSKRSQRYPDLEFTCAPETHK